MKLPSELSDNAAQFVSRFFLLGGLTAIALWLGTGQIAFVLLSIVFMYLGRRMGWMLSRNILYFLPTVLVVVLCILWGMAVAFGIHALILWQHPNIILKIIFGFMLGTYVSIPNYGLVAESTIPPEALPKHNLISMLPVWSYIFASVAFAWLL